MQKFAQRIVQNNVALICIILLLGALAHAGMLTAPFKTIDDNASIINNPDIRSLANAGKIFTRSFFGGRHYYRPMVTLSFMAEYHFFGLRSFYYNLTNFALHLAVAVTVFFLVFTLLEDRAVAFFSSLLFAVHPVHWEAVANIPGRAILLSAFFTVNAFFFFCLSEERRRFLACYVLSLVLFAGGLLSKESAAMLPAVLLGYLFFSEKGAKRYFLIIPYLAIIAVYLVCRRALGIMEIYPWRSLPEHVLGFTTFLRAALTYARLLVWPTGLHFDRAQPMFLKFSDPELFATLIAYLALGIAFFKFRRRLPGYALFFASWFCIELFPVSQVITTIGVGPGFISAAEHFLYLPSIGAFALIALGVRELYSLNRKHGVISLNMFRIIISAGIFCLMLLTFYQEIFARSALSMFKRTLEYNPHNARILFSTGMELVNRDRFLEAEGYFRRACEREPLNAAYTIALGRSLYDQGKDIEAITVFGRVRDAGQYNSMLARNLREAYTKAIQRYQKRILREPENARAYYSLGTMYSRTGRFEESIEQYKRAAALKTDYREALFNLASSYGLLGDEDKAVEYFLRVVNTGGGTDGLDLFAYRHLGEIYQRKGDAAAAGEYFSKAEALESKR